MITRLVIVTVVLCGHLAQGLVDRPECVLWSKIENKTVPLQNQGHANCTTNPDCTGFNCVGIYQERPLSFGMRVHPCNAEPGVEIFGYAPQFGAKNFSHIFSHEDQYDIPGAFLNASVLSTVMSAMPHMAELGESLRGRMSVSLKMDHPRNILVMGLTVQACINETTCFLTIPVFNHSEIPVPPCSHLLRKMTKTNSVCSVSDIAACGENQVCVQRSPDAEDGTCQCQSGFSYESDGSCKANVDSKVFDDQLPLDLDNDVENRRDKKAAAASDSAHPSPASAAEGPSSGSVAAAVISIIVVVVVIAGAAYYVVTRTRLLPRLRAHMTNTPYECANLSQPPAMTANSETALP